MKPRWKRILAQMSGLNEQLGHLFVNRHFSPDSKQKVIDMVEDLREAYRERIKGLDWMTAETKVKALEKLDAFTYKIGYPDTWKDYSMVDVSRESYLKNSMAISAHRTRENLARLNKPVDRNEWFMGAHVVNAYYNPSFNEVVFPAGILQPPFFNPDADDAINYGAIGGVIGHEFTHGFDDKGSLYGADGNLGNWWTAEDRERFDALVKRVIQQYSEYEPLPGLNINGALTVGENIADFGGITLGYYAYLKSREGKEQLPPIDGFTDKQRVFMGWSQVWQAATTDEFLRNQVLTDPHYPALYRVNGPLSNMQEFWDAFECKPEMQNFMRPDSTRIAIW
jgi:putative endopeptidase